MVPSAGSYAIWGRVLAPTATNNSFHLSIDSDIIDDDPTDGLSTIWDLPVGTAYTMSRVNMRIDAAGTIRHVRYRILPDAGNEYLDAAGATAKGPNFLMEELAVRLGGRVQGGRRAAGRGNSFSAARSCPACIGRASLRRFGVHRLSHAAGFYGEGFGDADACSA